MKLAMCISMQKVFAENRSGAFLHVAIYHTIGRPIRNQYTKQNIDGKKMYDGICCIPLIRLIGYR